MRELSGTATYDGVAFFEVRDETMPSGEQVRGVMSVEVTFSSQTPALTGTITIDGFVSESDQTLQGGLGFIFELLSDTFEPMSSPTISGPLTGTLQVPDTQIVENTDASIFGIFVGDDGQFIAGNITDNSGPIRIDGGFVAQDKSVPNHVSR